MPGGAPVRARGSALGRGGVSEHPRRVARLPAPVLPPGARSAIGMDPSFTHAQLMFSKGETREAHRCLDTLLAGEPAHLGALLLKARLLLEARADDDALVFLDRAVAAWPRSAQALDARARCLHALGRDEEALAHAREARARLGGGDNFRHAGAVDLTMG